MVAPAQLRSIADPMDRARRLIEGDVTAPLTLADLAGAAGLSPHHFLRLFAARYGLTPMAYVRVRRLEAAAERLRGARRTSLIDLALDFGFDSQEGFTRAFTREFGISPGRYRDGERPPRPPASETELIAMPSKDLPPANLTQAPSAARKPAMRIAGMGRDFDETNMGEVPQVWDRFGPRLPFPSQVGGGTFGVCCAGPGGKGLHYIAGAILADGAPVPEGMEAIEIPARSYLVFRQVLTGGPLHPQMQAAIREIWAERVPNSGKTLARGAPDLEVYPDDFAPNRAGAWVEWWIPVEA
jgi:AraC family transcriptional regulator